MKPLAERLRPQQLNEIAGQRHLIGENAILFKSIHSGNIPSMIFWGPPGVGKTTLANVIANEVNANFYTLSAINSGVKDIRDVIENAGKLPGNNILFIDEIHRFNKAQQDSLLGAVEKGIITLIGATTENPSFEVISALLSRCQVYILKPLEKEELIALMQHAIKDDAELQKRKIIVSEYEALLRLSGGDARKLLNTFELVVNSIPGDHIEITNNLVLTVVQKNMALYDKGGEQHYDIISAFIKSIRGSDPNAAVYWMARMLEGGEDIKFIARRMVILASEDIGNANPNALLLANTCFDAISKIGMPEARIILSQTATYLASSPKSNASYLAIDMALDTVRKTGDLPVPLHLRNAPTKLMKDIGYGKEYKYSHNYAPGEEGAEQEFLPDKIGNTKFYEPNDNPRENELRNYLKKIWKGKYGY